MKTKKSQSIEEKFLEVNNVLISGVVGGGDVLIALHVRWLFEKKAPHVNWIHGGVTAGPTEDFHHIEIIEQASAWVNEKSTLNRVSSGEMDVIVRVAWAILMTCGNMDDMLVKKNLILFLFFYN